MLTCPSLLAQAAGFSGQTIISTAADRPTDVYAADLNGDGFPDVLSASFSDDKLAWYPNLGGGVFGAQQVISTSANQPRSVFAADLDGDGDKDVLSASHDDKIVWHENLGGGNFGPQQIISTQVVAAGAVDCADFDGDGQLDVMAIGSGGFDKLGWFRNLGGGAFGPLQAIEVGNSGNLVFGGAVCAADFNLDGTQDVVTASAGDDKIAWYANWPTVTTFGSGCGNPPMVFSPTTPATINSPVTATIVHSPSTLCVIALGLSKTTMPSLGALPFDLSSLGMDGCALYQSSEVFGLSTQPSANPFLEINWTVPGFPLSAQGMHFYAQAFSFAPGSNALEVISSNAADWTISL